MLSRGSSSHKSHPAITASAVFLVLFSLYALTYQGAFRVDDEHILAARAQSLALWGQLEQPQVFGNERERELQAMGHAATQIEPGQAVFGAVVYRAGARLGLGGSQALFVQNALLTAATGALLVLSVHGLGFTAATAAAVGLLFGLGTYAWPYATTYFRDPQAAFGMALAVCGWVHITRPRRPVPSTGWIALGIGILLGVSAKNAALVLVPSIALALPLVLWRASHSARKRWIIWLVSATVLGLALLLLPKPVPLARYSLDYYVTVGKHFLSARSARTAIEGVLGPFVSPASSLFLFCPPLLLCLAIPRRWWKEEVAIAGVAVLTAVGLALAQVLFYGDYWAGAVGWGPRAMLLAVPGLMLLVAPAVARLEATKGGCGILVALGVLSFAVQLSGVLIPWQVAHEAMRAMGLDAYSYTGPWDIRRLLLIHQIPMLAQVGVWSTAWTRVVDIGSRMWVLPVVLSLLGVLIGWVLSGTRRVVLSVGLTALTSVAVLTGMATAWVFDPYWQRSTIENSQAISYVQAGTGTEDVVLLDAYGTPAWFRMMNEWCSPVRWYALPFEMPETVSGTGGGPQTDVVVLMQALLAEGGRVWLVASSEAPDYLMRDESTWLQKQAVLVSSRSFTQGQHRVDVFEFAPR
jgi:hypothetical protein